MDIKPTIDILLVEPVEESNTVNKLYVPKESLGEPSKGIILAVNRGNADVFKVSDRIFFRPEFSNEVIIDNKTFLLIRVSDVLAIF